MNENIQPQQDQQETRSRKFWRVVLGSMVGFVLASIIVSVLSILMFLGMIASLEKTASSAMSSSANVKDNSVLVVDLSTPIAERAVEIPFDFGSYAQQSVGLDKILASLKSAAGDSKIKGIYLKTSTVSAAPASIKAIRDALMEFKKSGKFVYAYSDVYTQNGYYMSTVADKILLNPSGDMSLKGYAFQLMFYKNLLDKMDVDVQIFRHGQFKSAVEPYFLDKMSEANREQMSTLANSLWQVFLQDVSKARNISTDDLNNIADNLLCSSPKAALELKLVDQLAYADEAEKLIKVKLNLGENDKPNYVSLGQYAKTLSEKDGGGQKVAVFYAFGDISDAYVCFGGTALFPSVRVLSADEVKKLSKILNSMEWEEFPDKPETPATPGPNDLTLYINDNGKRSQLGLLGDTYCDENGYRYFRTRSPENVEENISLHQICSDLLFDSDLENVSTHLSRFLEISQPDGSYDINEYWDLIWDDVMQYINDEATQDDNIE